MWHSSGAPLLASKRCSGSTSPLPGSSTTARIRTASAPAWGAERLDPWDVVFFPKAPDGAHGIRNETEATARVLMFSTVVVPTATIYPDSGKVGIWTGDPETDLVVRPRTVKTAILAGPTALLIPRRAEPVFRRFGLPDSVNRRGRR